MTDIVTTPALPPETASRSLFQLAALRFRRNRAAMAGCVMLVLIAMFSFLGPHFISHSYDQVFPSYVSIPPSFEPRPDASSLQDVIEGVAGRARVEVSPDEAASVLAWAGAVAGWAAADPKPLFVHEPDRTGA